MESSTDKPTNNRDDKPEIYAEFPRSEEGQLLDLDAKKLEAMGYLQPMERKFSVLSVLGAAYSLTNSWWGLSTSLVTGLGSGGSALLVYGTILETIVSTAVAATLSELVSSMPNAAGQSYWAKELAPKRMKRLASYITGWLAWSGSVFAAASIALGVAEGCMGAYILAHPEFETKPWHYLVCYEIANAFAYLFNIWGPMLSPMGHICLYTSLGSFIAILITVPATAETYTSAKFVFATFSNTTGWQNNGIAFMVGLINTNWGFSCLDAAVHLAEEIPNPERMIPIAIMGVIAIGFVTSFAFVLGMLFSVQDVAAFLAAEVPSAELFHQALRNTPGAIVLMALSVATGVGCIVSSHTWAARLCWSFSRDRGIPFHNVWSQIAVGLDTPLAAHTLNSFIIAIIGFIYLGSQTAFNSLVTACIVLPYLSYVFPVMSLLLRGRKIMAPGPFYLGNIGGYIANTVCIGWILFSLVFYSFPAQMPAKGGNMNYISVIYGIVAFLATIDWFTRGHREYLSNMHTGSEEEVYAEEARQASSW